MFIAGIAIRSAKRAPLQEVSRVWVDADQGLKGDSRSLAAKPHRKVTLISLEQWQEVCRELGIELPWYTRRANICVEGVRFGPEHVGKNVGIYGLQIAPILEITEENTPCHRMDEIHPGLKNALAKNWRGGVCCKVWLGGPAETGFPARIWKPQQN